MYLGTQFPQIEITWINDSSCTLTFPDEAQTEQAYMQFSVRPASLRVNLDKQGASSISADIENIEIGLDENEEAAAATKEAEPRKVDERNFDSKLGWREALNFEHQLKGWQQLWIRFATDLDVKKEDTKGENSRFYKFAQRTRGSTQHTGSRFGSHPGDRRKRDNRDGETQKRVGRKQISKNEKYGRSGRRGRRQDDSDGESSDLENSADKNKDESPKEQQVPALDDGQTRSEVDVNFISKSAGILKAETMQEQVQAVTEPAAAAITNQSIDDWDEENKL